MLTQIEAEIETDGSVVLLEPVNIKKKSRAIVIVEVEKEAPESNGGSKDNGADVSELFGSVSLGHPVGIDNEAIDADLAKEYAGRE
ncbi:MAG: hypothetical protein KF855_00870 [Acidobacteria bacterium]|nr:hypothetical protein [Acidobacteriota bacterium]